MNHRSSALREIRAVERWQLGRVEHVVAPNYEHVKYVAQWAAQWPDAHVYGALHYPPPPTAVDVLLQAWAHLHPCESMNLWRHHRCLDPFSTCQLAYRPARLYPLHAPAHRQAARV